MKAAALVCLLAIVGHAAACAHTYTHSRGLMAEVRTWGWLEFPSGAASGWGGRPTQAALCPNPGPGHPDARCCVPELHAGRGSGVGRHRPQQGKGAMRTPGSRSPRQHQGPPLMCPLARRPDLTCASGSSARMSSLVHSPDLIAAGAHLLPSPQLAPARSLPAAVCLPVQPRRRGHRLACQGAPPAAAAPAQRWLACRMAAACVAAGRGAGRRAYRLRSAPPAAAQPKPALTPSLCGPTMMCACSVQDAECKWTCGGAKQSPINVPAREWPRRSLLLLDTHAAARCAGPLGAPAPAAGARCPARQLPNPARRPLRLVPTCRPRRRAPRAGRSPAR